MALFGSKKKPAEKSAPKTASKAVKKDAPAKAAAVPSVSVASVRDVIKHARITEKASDKQMMGVYVFDVTTDATKRDVIRSMQALYKVTPRKVAMITVKSKQKRNARTGRPGMKTGGKKAYVYLRSGETITL